MMLVWHKRNCNFLSAVVHNLSLSKVLILFSVFDSAVWSLALDSLHVNLLDELKLGESYAGVLPVDGLNNGSKAFLFQGKID